MNHFIDPSFFKHLQRIQNSYKAFSRISAGIPVSYFKTAENLRKSLIPYSQISKDVLKNQSILKKSLHNALSNFRVNEKFIRQMQEVTAAQAKMISNLPDLSHISKMIEDARINTLPYLKSIHLLYDNLDSIKEITAPLSFGEALQHVQQVYDLTKEENQKDIVSFVQQVEAKTTAAPQSFLSAEFFISLIFALIFFLYSQHSANISEQNLSEQIQHLEKVMTELPNALMPLHDNSTYYVALKYVNLRKKPKTKSAILEILHPNLKVKLLVRKGKWIQIQYYDHVNNEFKTGWVYKKNLKILNRKRPGEKAF